MESKVENHRICKDGATTDLNLVFHNLAVLVESNEKRLTLNRQLLNLVQDIRRHHFGLLSSQNRAGKVRMDILNGKLRNARRTGKVPFFWMQSNDLTMSGMARASAQSQSSRPSLTGRLPKISRQATMGTKLRNRL